MVEKTYSASERKVRALRRHSPNTKVRPDTPKVAPANQTDVFHELRLLYYKLNIIIIKIKVE